MAKAIKKSNLKKKNLLEIDEEVNKAIVKKKLGKPLPNKFLALLVKNHILNEGKN